MSTRIIRGSVELPVPLFRPRYYVESLGFQADTKRAFSLHHAVKLAADMVMQGLGNNWHSWQYASAYVCIYSADNEECKCSCVSESMWRIYAEQPPR